MATSAPKAVAAPAVEDSRRTWSLEKWALAAQTRLLWACPFYWFIDHRETTGKSGNWDGRRAAWVAGALVLLFVLWLLNPGPTWAKILVGAIASWRLLEIFVTGLGTALGQEAQVRARNLITIAFYGLHTILIFAILYHSVAVSEFAATETSGAVEGELASTDYLYISWAAFTSLGNESFTPTTEMARWLEAGTTTTGILLLGVLLAFGIDAVRGKKPAAG